MPRRRPRANALKTFSSAVRAGLRLAGAFGKAAQQLGRAARPGVAKSKTVTGDVGRKSKPSKPKSRAPAKMSGSPSASSKPIAARSGAPELGRFRGRFGTRAYRLYPPTAKPAFGERAPLVVMLHGCMQDAAAFAHSTRMAELAGAAGCWVLFPEQAEQANRARCWNWFEPEHQGRGAGEPAVLAGLVRKIVAAQGLDRQRVFVAGLSAGGAMAVVLGRTHPELFAAVGVCAGMPYGAARTAATALLAMRGRHKAAVDATSGEGFSHQPVRAIVFQGTHDRTVAPANADAIASQALTGFGTVSVEAEEGAAGGRAFLRVRHRSPDGRVAVEQWTVRGGGHAWPGGRPGRFSDAAGPDASAAMLGFFLKVESAEHERQTRRS